MKLSDTIGLLLKSKDQNRVLSVSPDQSVYEAIEKMAEHGIGALLVILNERLVGILSERDYARKVILMGHSSKETPVRQIMTTPVVFVTPQQNVDECMAIMTKHHFRHLPVVQDGTVVGVVSIGDLVKWIISGQAQTIQELEGTSVSCDAMSRSQQSHSGDLHDACFFRGSGGHSERLRKDWTAKGPGLRPHAKPRSRRR